LVYPDKGSFGMAGQMAADADYFQPFLSSAPASKKISGYI